MDTATLKEYKDIVLSHPVSVESMDKTIDEEVYTILLMGPTGAGKSSFIEAFGLSGVQSITSNQLEGFTQNVSTYKLNNVVDPDGDPIYMVDSPGFADTKISEMWIVSMLKEWIETNRTFSRILYFTPITHVRLPGSHRRVLQTFRTLTGVDTAENITIVTTMWDSIWGERAMKRAEETFKQLQNDIWKDFIQDGAHITKFLNTQDSALSVLDEALGTATATVFGIEAAGPNFREEPFGANLYRDLKDRIQNLQSQILTLHLDLIHADEHANLELKSILQLQLNEAQMYLEKFQKELEEFGPDPNNPSPPPHATVSADLQITADAPQLTSQVGQPFHDSTQPQRGRLAHVIHFMCCGKAVGENHND